MLRLIFWRLVQLPLLLCVIYTATFVLVWVVPGSPLEVEGRKPDKAIQEAMEAQYKLNRPVTLYFDYVENITGVRWLRTQLPDWAPAGLRLAESEGPDYVFNLGPSMAYKDFTVNEIVAHSLPISIQLGAAAILIALVVGVVAGVLGAVRRGGLVDNATLGVALIGISLPTFVTGTVLLLVFALQLKWLPVGGWGSFGQVVLPAITLSLPFAAYIARLTRLGMIDVMSSDFVRTARAKGQAERKVVMRHALKVAFLPVLSFLGPAAAAAMTGSFVVEKVFNLPGMGQHFVDGVLNKDIFLIMGVVLVYATLLILFNLAVDIAYSFVDPRIDLEE